MLRRGGSFSLDSAGVLTDDGGNPVLGESGAVVVPAAGEIVIEPDGTVRADGAEIARLRVEDAAEASLRRAGGGLWTSDSRTALEPERVRLHQGFLEESNVQALDGLTEMLEVQRNYAAIQKGVMTLDSVMDTAANRIGRVG
jgi:flagellar basal body rod protein FlgG